MKLSELKIIIDKTLEYNKDAGECEVTIPVSINDEFEPATQNEYKSLCDTCRHRMVTRVEGDVEKWYCLLSDQFISYKEVTLKCGHYEKEEPTIQDSGNRREFDTGAVPAFEESNYYGEGQMQAINIIEHYDLNFNLGNVIKYVLRKKPGNDYIQDLTKARNYIDREIKRRTGNEV